MNEPPTILTKSKNFATPCEKFNYPSSLKLTKRQRLNYPPFVELVDWMEFRHFIVRKNNKHLDNYTKVIKQNGDSLEFQTKLNRHRTRSTKCNKPAKKKRQLTTLLKSCQNFRVQQITGRQTGGRSNSRHDDDEVK